MPIFHKDFCVKKNILVTKIMIRMRIFCTLIWFLFNRSKQNYYRVNLSDVVTARHCDATVNVENRNAKCGFISNAK